MKITLFLGAGASTQFGVPSFKQVTKDFCNDVRYSKHQDKLDILCEEFKRIHYRADIENYLSYLKAQTNPKNTLLSMHPFVNHFIHSSNTPNLNYSSTVRTIIKDIQTYLYEVLYVNKTSRIENSSNFYQRFFNFLNTRFDLRHADFKEVKLDIFTTNYDNIIEEFAERFGIEKYCGYNQTGDGFWNFDPDIYEEEDKIIKLYKLHGSVRLGKVKNIITNEERIIQSENSIDLGGIYDGDWVITDRLMIYGFDKEPSKEPYFDLLNILKNKLLYSDKVICTGFSFSDRPINK